MSSCAKVPHPLDRTSTSIEGMDTMMTTTTAQYWMRRLLAGGLNVLIYCIWAGGVKVS